MAALAELGVASYAVDLRGFGRTAVSRDGEPAPRDRLIRPSLAASDVADAVEWVRERIGQDVPLGLLGWSYGALVVALAAAGPATRARVHAAITSLVLYGTVWDEVGDYCDDSGRFKAAVPRGPNSIAGAMDDFGIPDSLSPAQALAFGEACVSADPLMVTRRASPVPAAPCLNPRAF